MADDIANTTEEARFIKQTRNFDIQRDIVKIGSSLLTNNGRGLDRTAIYEWAKQIAKLHKQGVEVLLVSSGAVAEGVVRMNLCHLYTSPSPRDKRQSRMPSSA